MTTIVPQVDGDATTARGASTTSTTAVTTAATTPAVATAQPLRLAQLSPTLQWLYLHFPPSQPDGTSAVAGPSPALQRVFALHRPDPSAVIGGLVRRLCLRVLPAEDPQSQLAQRLYWAMLENMTTTETIRLTRLHERQVQAANQAAAAQGVPPPTPAPLQLQFGMWLGSAKFHAAVLSVALEVVMYAHCDADAIAAHAAAAPSASPSSIPGASLLFPAVLARMDLSAWDFLRNLEVSVRHLPTLLAGGKGSAAVPPPLLKQYLKRLENDCISWRIWARGSPLLAILAQQERVEEQAQAQALKTAAAVPAGSAPAADESKQSGSGSAAAVSVAAIPNLDASVGQEWGSVAVEQLFTRQLLSLTAQRIALLCGPSGLNVSTLLMESCWALMMEIFSAHKNLLHNRHLDTIILCVLYNVVVKVGGEISAANAAAAAASSSSAAATAGAVPAAPAAPAAPAPIDFKRIIAVYLQHWEQNGAMVIREVSTWHAASTPSSAASTTASQAASAAATTAAAPAADAKVAPAPAPAAPGSGGGGDSTCNVIVFYNKYFIHGIKNFTIDVIKPAVAAALAQQAQTTAQQQQQQQSQTRTAKPGLPPHHMRSPLSTNLGGGSVSFPSPTLGPASAYSPLRNSRLAGSRFHPYAIGASPAGGAAAAAAPGTPAPGPPPSSIHAYLDGSKAAAHAATPNVYLSRMTASPLHSPGHLTGFTLSIPRGANAATTSSNGFLGVPPAQPRPTFTPTKAKVSMGVGLGSQSQNGTPRRGDSDGSSGSVSKQEDAMALLSAFPASPALAQPQTPLSHGGVSLSSRGSYHSGTPAGTSLGPLTPRSKQLYAFGESPRKAIDDINAMLSRSDAAAEAAAAAAALSTVHASTTAGFGASSFASPSARTAPRVPSGSGGGSGSGRTKRQLF